MDTCQDHIKLFSDVEVIKNTSLTTNALINKFLDEIKIVNDRCLTHLGNYRQFSEHIKESKENKKWYKDKVFQVVMFISGCAWAVVFLWVQYAIANITSKANAELREFTGNNKTVSVNQ
jgi:hypothetical protein